MWEVLLQYYIGIGYVSGTAKKSAKILRITNKQRLDNTLCISFHPSSKDLRVAYIEHSPLPFQHSRQPCMISWCHPLFLCAQEHPENPGLSSLSEVQYSRHYNCFQIHDIGASNWHRMWESQHTGRKLNECYRNMAKFRNQMKAINLTVVQPCTFSSYTCIKTQLSLQVMK